MCTCIQRKGPTTDHMHACMTVHTQISLSNDQRRKDINLTDNKLSLSLPLSLSSFFSLSTPVAFAYRIKWRRPEENAHFKLLRSSARLDSKSSGTRVCVSGSDCLHCTYLHAPVSSGGVALQCSYPYPPSAYSSSGRAGQQYTHSPSIAFRHLPPKEGCRKPVLGVCSIPRTRNSKP